MRFFYPPYDFIILGTLTLITGYILQRLFFDEGKKTRIDKLFPYCLMYIPISLAFAFISNDLPLKFYIENNQVYDSSKNAGQPCCGDMGAGLAAFWIGMVSVAFNFAVWISALAIVIRFGLKKKRSRIV